MDEQSAGVLSRELAALRLDGVTGYRVLPRERRVLVGLAPGPVAEQLASGPDGDDHLEAHLGGLSTRIQPVLEKHVPGKQWSSGWLNDESGHFGSDGVGTVLVFEWR